MTRARRAHALRGDDGSTLPLIAFYAFLGLVTVLIVTAATSLYLEKKRLFTLADGAALVGAEAFELSDIVAGPGGVLPVLTDADVADAVDGYLAATPATGFDGLAVDAAFTPDGLSATVTMSSTWHPPVVTMFVPDGIRIDATATARSVFGSARAASGVQPRNELFGDGRTQRLRHPGAVGVFVRPQAVGGELRREPA